MEVLAQRTDCFVVEQDGAVVGETGSLLGETRYGGETGVVCFKNPAPSCQWCCVNKQNFVSIGALAAFAQIAHDTTVPVLAAKRVVGRLCP